MSFSTPSRAHHRAWQLLLGLTLLAWLCRALVPMGYMPEANAAERLDGVLISICGQGDGVVWALPLDPAEPEPLMAADPCPYAVAPAQALLPPEPDVVLVRLPTTRQDVPRLVQAVAPPLPALGPPLGSRAPPLALT